MPDIDITLWELSGYDLSGTLLAEETLYETFFQNMIADLSALDYVWLSVVLLLFFFWIVALIWTVKDSAARSDSFWFQFFSILLVIVLTPFLWLPLYIAYRPQGFKWDKSPWRTALLDKMQMCGNCKILNPIEHVCCVSCGDRLKHNCRECDELYAMQYEYCPFCGAPNIEK